MDFVVHNPKWIEELPDLPGCDNDHDLWRRADYDHRITLPIELFPEEVSKYLYHKKGMAVVFRYYRCSRVDMPRGSCWPTWDG